MQGFLWESKNGSAAVFLSKQSGATSSRKKGLFHYLVAGASSGSDQAFIWRAAKYAKFPSDSKTQVRLRQIKKAHIELSSGTDQLVS